VSLLSILSLRLFRVSFTYVSVSFCYVTVVSGLCGLSDMVVLCTVGLRGCMGFYMFLGAHVTDNEKVSQCGMFFSYVGQCVFCHWLRSVGDLSCTVRCC
jgi:hypothetical protein